MIMKRRAALSRGDPRAQARLDIEQRIQVLGLVGVDDLRLEVPARLRQRP